MLSAISARFSQSLVSRQRWQLCVVAGVLLMATGCASPGPPHAPSLHLPAVVDTLVAQRLGDTVVLTWTTPTQTTDGETIKGPVTAQVCRETGSAGLGRPVPCLTVMRQVVAPGASRLVVPLPPALLAAPASLLAFRLELQNGSGRSAGPSGQAFTAGGPAPEALVALRVVTQREGALLTWKPAAGTPARTPQEAPDRVQLQRSTESTTGPRAVKPPSRHPNALTARDDEESVTLEAAPTAIDPGGMLDRSVRASRVAGQSYRYIAQRVRVVTLAGQRVELRGLPSAPVIYIDKDNFAANRPTGLVTIPAGSGHSVDLSWETNPENDLEGYNVYRRSAAGAFVRLNATPLAVPAYRDEHITAGTRYTWRVTALRAGGVESAASEEASETVAK